MTTLPPPLAVFDLDGTIADTAPDLLGALNDVLRAEGLAPATREIVGRGFGHGARPILRAGLAAAGAEADDARIEALVDRFIAAYGARVAVDSRLYPGLVAALDRLEGTGVRLAVCTNKRQALAEPLLSAFGLASRFAAIVGGDALPVKKPDPRHLAAAIARAGGTPARAVMIGDSDADVAAARALGVKVIAVSFGYSDVPVHDLGADAVIDHFDGLDAAIAGLLPDFRGR